MPIQVQVDSRPIQVTVDSRPIQVRTVVGQPFSANLSGLANDYDAVAKRLTFNDARAATSAGGVLESNNGTLCLTWGAGGGSNLTAAGGLTAQGLLQANAGQTISGGTSAAPALTTDINLAGGNVRAGGYVDAPSLRYGGTDLLARANTWTSTQTISTAGATPLALTRTGASLNSGVGFAFRRVDSNNTQFIAAQVFGVPRNITPGSTQGSLTFFTHLNGVESQVAEFFASGSLSIGTTSDLGRLGVKGGATPGTPAADEARISNGIGAYGVGINVGANAVVRSRVTGWAAATGTATRTTFATGTVTTAQLAERVKALIDDLIAHGLIGA